MNNGSLQAASRLARILRGDTTGVFDDNADPGVLAEVAQEQGVECLIWHALDRSSGASAALRGALDLRVRAAAAREFFVRRDLTSALARLSEAGIRAVIFKGTALGYSIYDEAWHRPTIDTDILVAPADAAAAEHVLLQSGYLRSHAMTSGAFVSHQVSLERTDASGVQHAVDLHWKIVNPQVLAGALLFDDLWSDSVTVPRLGPAARMPSLVKSLVLACIHRLAHHQGQDRLIWLYDIRLLAARLDEAGWTELVRLAEERRVAGLCLDGLEQAREQLDVRVPAAIVEALSATAPREASHRYLEGTVNRRHVLASDLASLGSWRERLQLIREHAFPPAAFIRERYGVKSPLWLPALYLHRLLTGAHKWVKP